MRITVVCFLVLVLELGLCWWRTFPRSDEPAWALTRYNMAALIRYSTADLRNFRSSPLVLIANLELRVSRLDLPKELKARKRGRRGGVRVRNRKRGFKPFLPSAIIGNVQSIQNKLDELHASIHHEQTFRTCSMLCFTESWLHDQIPDNTVAMDGFTMFRADRKKEAGKKKGGGLCVYINKQWCNPNNTSLRSTLCTPDVELLTVSARPYYLPREFTHVIIVTAYVPPRACAQEAAEHIASHVHDLDTQAPDAFKVITGDFNNCDLQKKLHGYHQQVECTTRGQRKLDLFYCSVKDAYVSGQMPPLGRSDHNLVSLVPKYRPLVQRVPPQLRSVQKWSADAWDALIGCFECTDWTVFVNTASNVSELADTVCCYVHFCAESVVARKTVKVFSNNKPWVTKQVREVLNRKKQAFREGDRDQLKGVQKELKRVLR